MRSTLRRTIGLLLLLLLVRTFVALGVVRPVVVHGGSMAPRLVGNHLLLRCDACGGETRFATNPPPAPRTPCPACGWALAVESAVRGGPDTLLIDRTTTRPARWERVVARRPDGAAALCVKRVAGLPGETIGLRGGDVWVDGRRIEKSLSEQRRLRVPVHRETALASRWRAPEGGWRRVPGGWRSARAGGLLVFAPPGGEPVSDDLPYNAGLSRRTNPTGDLMVTAELALGHSGALTFTIDTGTRVAAAYVGQSVLRLSLTKPSGPVDQTERSRRRPDGGQPTRVTLSTIDRVARLKTDGVAELALRPVEGPDALSATAGRLTIRAHSRGVEVRDLCVWRDIFYEASPATGRIDSVGTWRLGRDSYFLLGDNQAVSLDSRHWCGGGTADARGGASGVPRGLLIGVVVGVD